VRGVRRTERGVEVVDVPAPSDGVRVTVTSAGICGSDFHLIASGPLPQTLGHEFGGILDDGTPVAVRPNVTCGTCPACTTGRAHLCSTALGRFHGVSIDGGLADEVGVEPACIVTLPPDLDPADAALAEPVAVAVHGIRRCGVTAGQRVLVIGAGPIGLCAIAAAVAAGADVDVVAHRDVRRAAAGRLGARPASDRAATGGAASGGPATGGVYDVVVDAAGTTASGALAVDEVAPGGTVGMLGTWWDPVSLDGRWQLKEVSLVPAFLYGQLEFASAVRLLASVPVLRDVIVTHRFSLDDAAEAFRTAADRSSGAIKVLIHP
jgi:threonine dehydrogenase-like Zn-dependent dehydrogenase